MNEHEVKTDDGRHEMDMKKILATHSPRDLLIVGLVYALGGGGVNVLVGVRFLMGESSQETAAAVMFFVVSALMVTAGAWCWVKRARLLKASRS